MKAVVFDTSAFLRLCLPDGPIPEGAQEAYQSAERGDMPLLAPELIVAEGAQALHRKLCQGLITASEQAELLDDLLSAPFQLFSHKPLTPRAIELARSHSLTVYDALFLALAEKYNARLFTTDVRLLRGARRMHLA